MALLLVLSLLAAFDTRYVCASSVSGTSIVSHNETATSWSAPSLRPQDISTSHAPGYYVAAGLGLAMSETSVTQSSESLVSGYGNSGSQSSRMASSKSIGSTSLGRTSTRVTGASSSVFGSGIRNSSTATRTAAVSLATHYSYFPANTTQPPGITAVLSTGHLSFFGNATNATGIDACWTEWNSYWSATPGGTFVETEISLFNTTFFGTNVQTSTALSSIPLTYEVTNTQTEIAANGPWLETTKTLTSTYTASVTYSPIDTVTTAVPWNLTATWFSYGDVDTYTISDPKKPHCKLPTSYSSCQESWERWATTSIGPILGNGYLPSCTQANVTGSICSTLVEAAAKSLYRVTNWPTSSYIAPGCNLGCGKCAVTGGTIELLYFPPGLTPATFGVPVIATTLNTTLTSPTFYLSLASVFASDSCGAVGATKAATIIPVRSEDLSSSWEKVSSHSNAYDWGCALESGIAPFNLTNIAHTPVPYSIYESQPYCAEFVMAPEGFCSIPCPTTLPYKPIVVVPPSILNALDPAWATCYLDLRGLYDPPKLLTPVSVASGPQITPADATTTIAATPASGPATQTGATNTSPATTSSAGAPVATYVGSSPASEESATPVLTSTISESVQSTPLSPAESTSSHLLPVPYTTSSQSSQVIPSDGVDSDPGSPASDTATPPEQHSKSAGTAQDAGSVIATSAVASNPAPQIISALQLTTAQEATVVAPAASGDDASTASGPASQIPSALQSTSSEENITGPAASILASALDTSSTTRGAGEGSVAEAGGTSTSFGISSAATGVSDPSVSASDGLAINGQTLQPGETSIVSGRLVSVGTGYAVVAGSTVSAPSAPTTIVVADQTYGIDPAETASDPADPSHPSGQGVVVGSQTLLPGEKTTVSGKSVSVGTGYVVIAGSTITPTSSQVTAVFPDQTFAVQLAESQQSDPSSSSDLALTTTGQAGTGETAISLDPSLVITATAGKPLVIAGETIGSAGLAVSGHVLSQSGTQLVIDGTRTVDLSTASPASGANVQATNDIFTTTASIDRQTFTVVNDPSGYGAVVNGVSISSGDPTTIVGGQTISALAGGIVIGSRTITSAGAQSPVVTTAIVDGQPYTIGENPAGQGAVINGNIVSVGGSANVIGSVTISAATNAVVIGETTITGLSEQDPQASQLPGSATGTSSNAAGMGSSTTQTTSDPTSTGATNMANTGRGTTGWVSTAMISILALLAA